jgi:chemotaxis protein CheD
MAISSPPMLVAGIGEMVLSADPGTTLVAYGLGSCIGLALWDPRTKVAGLAHFMLPSGPAGASPVKFVDTGMPAFLAAFIKLGGDPARSQVKAAGGASMLALVAGTMEIGKRNAEAVQTALAARGMRLGATELGGKVGRTVQLDVGTGRLLVKGVASTSTL